MEKNTPKIRPLHAPTEHHSHVGPILGVIVIMLVLALSGLYLWGGVLSREKAPAPMSETGTLNTHVDVEMTEALNPSDSPESTEADQDTSDVETLDIESDSTLRAE